MYSKALGARPRSEKPRMGLAPCFAEKIVFFFIYAPLPIGSDFIRGTGVPHFVPHFQKVWLFAPRRGLERRSKESFFFSAAQPWASAQGEHYYLVLHVLFM